MSTRANANAVTTVPALALSSTSPVSQIEFATLAILCGVLAAGAYFCFPLYDDGWLALVLRESGPHFLAQHMGDRPVFGFLLEQVGRFGAANRFVFVLLNSGLWLTFAVESGLLFRRLFPELGNYSVVAACLTLAPIVLQTQLSTALVVIPANLATIFGYAAILLLLQQRPAKKSNKLLILGVASALAAFGVVLSEYGVATNLVGCALLIGMALTRPGSVGGVRRQLLISAGWLFGLTVAAYLIFAKTADFSTRPDVAPGQLVQRGAAKWLGLPFELVAGTWHAVVGAYAVALGSVTVAWDSKSTLAGVLFGFLIAILVYFATQGPEPETTFGDRTGQLFFRLMVFLPAIFIGLLPFSVMGRPTVLLEFGSRFRIPVMPVAAAITVALAITLVRRPLRWIPVMMFGFIVGYASWTFTYSAIQQSRAISALRVALRPYVAQSGGYTVAVVPFDRFETELTANIAAAWPVEMEKKLWVVGEGPARSEFGNRSDCHSNTSIDVNVRGLTRMGKLDNLLWLDTTAGKPVSIEQYCTSAK